MPENLPAPNGEVTGGVEVGARLLSDKFEVLSEISSGGFGRVLRVRQTGFDRIFAAKLIRPDAANPESFKRLAREGQILTKLQHRNIVKVYLATFDDQLGLVIVMEFLDGKPLSALIREAGKLDMPTAFELATQISGALAYAHDNGILHRDLKPGNVMVLPDDGGALRAVLIDFGIAKLQDGNQQLTHTGAVLGTPLYMSPEQFQGRKLEGRSDIYSFGCLLYEMLTGAPPFAADNPLQIAAMHCAEAPRPPSDINPDVSPELETAVMKCLEKDPEKRYGTAAELHEELSNMVLGAPRRRKARRAGGLKLPRAGLVKIMAGMVVLAAMIGTVVYELGQKPRPPAATSPAQVQADLIEAQTLLYNGRITEALDKSEEFLRPVKTFNDHGQDYLQPPGAPMPVGYTPAKVIEGVEVRTLAKLCEVDRIESNATHRRQRLSDAKGDARLILDWIKFYQGALQMPLSSVRHLRASMVLVRAEAANKERRSNETEPLLPDAESLIKQLRGDDAALPLFWMRYYEAKAESQANLGHAAQAAQAVAVTRSYIDAKLTHPDKELQQHHNFWCDYVRKNLKYADPNFQSSSKETD